jgi:hypothetical protein
VTGAVATFYSGVVERAFAVPREGSTGLRVADVRGWPKEGLDVLVGGHRGKIVEVGHNGTDGKAVSFRDCATGLPTAGYGAVCVRWSGGMPDLPSLRGCRIDSA